MSKEIPNTHNNTNSTSEDVNMSSEPLVELSLNDWEENYDGDEEEDWNNDQENEEHKKSPTHYSSGILTSLDDNITYHSKLSEFKEVKQNNNLDSQIEFLLRKDQYLHGYLRHALSKLQSSDVELMYKQAVIPERNMEQYLLEPVFKLTTQ